MTLTQLRYIVAVARERHFGRAAEQCHVSQPTMSVGIKRLEEELGLVLFERGRQEISLTDAGEAIVAQARRVLEEAEQLKQLAAGSHDPLVGPLRVGAIYTVGPYLFPDLIPRLHELAPSMPLVVVESYTAELVEQLKRGTLDVAILSLPLRERGILTLPLYEEPFVLLLPASHPLTAREQVRRQALPAEDVLLLGQGHCFRDQVLTACPGCRQQLDDPLRGEGSSLETIRHMVASGLGITILPCTATGADKYSQRLLSVRRFAGTPPTRIVALAYRDSFPREQAVHALRQAVHNCLLSCVTMLA